MANIVDYPRWEDGIFQLETSTKVLGGEYGVSNTQAKQLANRTQWLKQQKAEITYVDAGLDTKADKSSTEQAIGDLENKKADKVDFDDLKGEVDELKTKSGLIVGMTFFSLLPITDAGVRLLDGALLPVGGVYDDFIKYVASLRDKYQYLFASENAWQESVVKYGSCGKFVYTEGVSLRLPKVSDIIQGTTDVNATGDLIEAGLPNIKGSFVTRRLSKGSTTIDAAVNYAQTGAFDRIEDRDADASTVMPDHVNQAPARTLSFDASAYNPIYGNSDTVQPQTIKGLLYIVVATAKKTDTEVDIDKIVTDLNEKADKSNYLPLFGGHMTGQITSEINDAILLETNYSSDDEDGKSTYVAKASAKATNQAVCFGIGVSGYNRGIWDEGTRDWIVAYDKNNNLVTGLPGAFSRVEAVAGVGEGWIRYKSGLQICFGGADYSATKTFPKPFIKAPHVVCSHAMGSTSGSAIAVACYMTATTAYFKNASSASGTVKYVAVGYWKGYDEFDNSGV